MNFLLSIAFYNLLFFIGRGFAISVSKLLGIKLKENIFGVFHENLFVIYTLFLIGNLSFLLNFFIPINQLIVLMPISIFLIFNFNNPLKFSKKNYFILFSKKTLHKTFKPFYFKPPFFKIIQELKNTK